MIHNLSYKTKAAGVTKFLKAHVKKKLFLWDTHETCEEKIYH